MADSKKVEGGSGSTEVPREPVKSVSIAPPAEVSVRPITIRQVGSYLFSWFRDLSKPLRAVIVSALLLTAIILVVSASNRWILPRYTVQGGRLQRVRVSDIPGVAILTWVNQTRCDVGKSIPAELVLENHSTQDLIQLTVQDFSAPGFEISIQPDADPKLRTWHNRPIELGAVQRDGSCRIRISLKAVDAIGKSRPTVLLTATDRAGRKAWNSVDLGPIEIAGRTDRFAVTVRHLRGIARDFGMPALIAILSIVAAIVATTLTKRYSEAEEQRAVRREVLKGQIPKALEDAQQYYLLVARRMSYLARMLKEFSAKKPDEDMDALVRDVFFALAVFLKAVYRMMDEIGGIHLMDLDAEALVTGAIGYTLRSAKKNFGEIELSAVLRAVDTFEFRVTFEERVLGVVGAGERRWFVEAEGALKRWLGNDGSGPSLVEYARLLELIDLIFSYEINRPFQIWYGPFPSPPVKDIEEKSADLNQTLAAAIKTSLDAYVGRARLSLAQTPEPGKEVTRG